ncbi:MAG: flippase [archaeon]
MIARTIAKNTFFLIFAEIIAIFLNFVLLIYLARFLGLHDFGFFMFALSFATLFVIGTDFGLSELVVREVARNKNLAKRYIDNILVIKTIFSVIIFALIFLMILLLQKSEAVLLLVLMASLYIVFNSFSGFFRGIFQAFEQMEYIAITRLLQSFLLFGITLYVLFSPLYANKLFFVFLAFVFSSLLAFLLTSFLVRKKFAKFHIRIDFSFWRKILHETWPFGLASIFSLIYFYLPTVFLSFIKGDASVGLFSAAFNLIFGLYFIPLMFASAIFPALSNSFKKSKKTLAKIYQKSIMFMYLLSLPFAVFTFLLSEEIIVFLYGQEFFEAKIVLQTLSFVLLLKYTSIIAGTFLSSINEQRKRMTAQGIAAFFCLISSIVLIYFFDFFGAAVSILLTELLLFGLYFWFATRFQKSGLRKKFVKPLIAIGASILFILTFRFLNVLILLVISLIIYFVLLLFLNVVSAKDLNLIRVQK